MKPQPSFPRSLSSCLSRPQSETSSKSSYRWHKPTISAPPNQENDEADVQPGSKPVLTVVLLGWLGSQQKHLKKYADWYNSQGLNAVTLTLRMAHLFSLNLGVRMRVGKKAEEDIATLTDDLSVWLAEKTEGGLQNGTERQLIFHTFSNTGWLIYGVLLDQLSSRGNWADRIKGCVVDSAPAAGLDPQIWASGFSEVLLTKRCRKSHAKGGGVRDSGIADSESQMVYEQNSSKPIVAELVSRVLLRQFFVVCFHVPAINNRLSQLITILSEEQPPCPQLYIYSSADKVIPSKLVESFMEKQLRQGRNVRGFDLQTSPHVDHFRSATEIYTSEIKDFLQECVYTSDFLSRL